MIISVHQPQYLAWLGYFDKINKSNCFVFLDTVQYKTREFQNRNKIRTKDSWIWLTVPVKTKGCSRQSIAQVLIDNEVDWAEEHKKSICSWYSHAPYFKRYFPFFESVYGKKWEMLCELNIHIIKYVLEELEIATPLYFESQIHTEHKSTRRIIEICQKLNADSYLSGAGGKNYLEEEEFEKAGIKLVYQNYEHPEYSQQFLTQKHPFEPYMSIVDLLFNEGPKSKDVIRETRNL
ncbi:MAG: WbqC family protein [Candidatus Omnitrophica bacterium]|nr:WbqC family protein [Candidatus Omnitrophota bacterium]